MLKQTSKLPEWSAKALNKLKVNMKP